MRLATRFAFAALTACGSLALFDCEQLAGGGALSGLSTAACPELSANVNAMGAMYTQRVDLNGKISAFVTSTKDLVGVASRAEAEVTEACIRIGRDIGLTDAQMQARNEAGGHASGACSAVSARMDQILAAGIQFRCQVTPPYCQANAQAYSSCSGACNGQVAARNADAECDASCRSHASFTASCSPAQVSVQANQNSEMAARLAASLQANLPLLLHGQIALGKRVLADADTMVAVGGNLPRIVEQAGAHAVACVAAAGNMSVQATASIKVSVQASANVSARAGAGG
jgi:hypothetical protein